ncbi:MAG TPA: ABC transporter permease [Marmoricola sp.]|jgi:ABC-type transport system involved in multi-copper enzyme maturation permease subunit|nr:ABC transporter permease [Marmoricola sp.]
MSTTTVSTYGDTLDVSQTARIPMTRLVKVELRKMVDTRAGMWLMIAIGVITAIASIIFGFVGHDEDRTFGHFLGFAGTPQGFLLPVLGILLVTQEWGQRTGMVTFTLEPHRGKVLLAKVYALIVLAVTAIILAFVVALLTTAIFGGTDRWSDFTPIDILKVSIGQFCGMAQGFAFGLLLLVSAAAIVTYFVLPQVITILVNVIPALEDKASWLDFNTAQQNLFSFGDGDLSSKEWTQLLVTGAFWLVLPFIAGLWRVLRAEVK